VLSLEPVPTNVTPADTTALYPPLLAKALRAHHGSVTEVVYPHHPERSDIDAAMRQADVHDLVVVGTVTATNGQADLVRGLIAGDRPVVTVALRTPYDLAAYPGASTHLCTYGSHLPSLTALAGCLFNGIADPGSLPVSIPGLYPIGHGLTV
jgi:beta-N-acetylhexosaminidase